MHSQLEDVRFLREQEKKEERPKAAGDSSGPWWLSLGLGGSFLTLGGPWSSAGQI